MKICTIVGTRPEIIRLSEIMKLFDRTNEVDHVLIHTSQNYDYELNEIFFEDLGLKNPKYRLSLDASSLASRIGSMLIQIEDILVKENPDSVLLLGDTYSCLSSIIVKNLKIPIFHMEAGNRCFDLNVPEEINRRIVDHISDINMPYSYIAREYLLREGVHPQHVIKTGSPMLEVLNSNMNKILNSNILDRLNLETGKYLLCSIHRAENVDNQEALNNIFDGIQRLSESLNITSIVSTHPRTNNRLKNKEKYKKNLRFLKPLSFSDYNKLQMESKLVLSDSGTISEESSILGFRAINVRTTHERPEAMEESTVIMSGTKSESIYESAMVALGMNKPKKIVNDYNVKDVSDKVLKIIMSYTGFVSRSIYRRKEML